MKKMIFNNRSITEAILKASRKLAAIITVMAVIVFSFAACNGDDNEDVKDKNDLPIAGNGSIDLSIVKTFNVEDNTTDSAGSDTIIFTKADWDSIKLSDFFDNYEVKIINNELSLKLGTPNQLNDVSKYFKNTTVTNGIKILKISNFNHENNWLAHEWWKINGNNSEGESIHLIYSDKSGSITSIYTEKYEDGWSEDYKMNMELKQGWNTIIWKWKNDENTKKAISTLITGKPGTEHKWALFNKNNNDDPNLTEFSALTINNHAGNTTVKITTATITSDTDFDTLTGVVAYGQGTFPYLYIPPNHTTSWYETGTFNVMLRLVDSPNTVKYQNGVEFTNGNGSVDWNTMN